MHVDDAAGRGLLGAVAFFQDFIQDAVIERDNPLLLGFDCQEGFIGFLVGVGSFLFHLYHIDFLELVAQFVQPDGNAQLVHHFHADEEEAIGLGGARFGAGFHQKMVGFGR